MPEHSGQTIKMADICVEVIDRKITRGIRIDCERYKVDQFGTLDKEHKRGSNIRMINLMPPPSCRTKLNGHRCHYFFEAKRQEHRFTRGVIEEIMSKII